MIAGLILLCLCNCLTGQVKKGRSHELGVHWGVSLPASGNFMNKASWIVPSAEYTWHVLPWFAAGGYVEYMSGQENGMTSDSYEGDPVSGYTDRKMSSFMAAVPFYFSYPLGRFEPYVRLSGGVVNTTCKITGDQINRSVMQKWAGVADLGIGCRYYWDEGCRWGVDLRCMRRWSNYSWELMDVRNDNRFEISLGVLVRLSR